MIRLPKQHRASVASAVVASAVTALVVVAVAGADSSVSKWIWHQGTAKAGVGQLQGQQTLSLTAAQDVDILGNHIRLGGKDGNFEFESYTPESHLNAYAVGSPLRHPISVGGGDDQDLTGFIVRGKEGGQTTDIQQWQVGSNVTAAIDGQGRLRLGSIVLQAAVVNGNVVLEAVMPNGKHQIIASG